MKKRLFSRAAFTLVIAALLAHILSASHALAATPVEELKLTIEYIQSVLNDPSLSEDAKKERVKKAAYDRFDFVEMSKRVLARHWTELTLVEQQEFINLFTKLLERVYFDRIKLIRDARFLYSGQEIEKGLAVVRSKATGAKGETVQIEYRLRLDGNWKIYDVSIEGISLVGNYRAQFNKIILRVGAGELLRIMREKIR